MADGASRILKREAIKLSPWMTVTARTLMVPGHEEPQVYHALAQADYVCVLALTVDGRIPLVRQYRPAVEDYTLEFPAGLRDGDEAPEVAAVRELTEEIGLAPVAPPTLIGCFAPDVGRLENKLWGFQATVSDVTVAGWKAEPGVERIFVTKAEFRELILNGTFDHALHVALIGMAMTQGTWEWNA